MLEYFALHIIGEYARILAIAETIEDYCERFLCF